MSKEVKSKYLTIKSIESIIKYCKKGNPYEQSEMIYKLYVEPHLNIDPLYGEYCEWLWENHEMAPDDAYHSINCVETMVSIRDEYMGLKGETELIKMLKEEGKLEDSQKKMLEDYSVITFEEYKQMKNKDE